MRRQHIFFEKLARLIVNKHKLILLIALILFLLSIFGISRFLHIKSNVKDLLDKNNPKIAEYNRIIKHFKSASGVFVILEGKKKDIVNFSEYFATNIIKDNEIKKYIRRIDLKIERDFFLKYGLLLAKTNDLTSYKFLYKKLGFLGFFNGINRSFENSYSDVNTHEREHNVIRFLDGFETYLENLINYMNTPNSNANNFAQRMVEGITIGESYYFSPEKNMQILIVQPTVNSDEYQKGIKFIKILRKKINLYKRKYPNVKVSLSGTLPLIADEMIAIEHDMSIPSYITLLLIIILFYISFKNISSTLFSILTLVIGIVISIGFCVIFVQELNQMTAFVMIILIGLGIDFGIHIISHFNDYYYETNDIYQTLSRTLKDCGLGIIIGATTTSLAFFTLLFTSAKAFKQLAFFAGTGILGCLAAMIIVLPSFLVLRFKKKSPKVSKINVEYRVLTRVGKFTVKHKYILIVAILILAGISLFFGRNVGFEYNMMKLEPPNMPSLLSMNKLIKALRISSSYAVVSTNDINEARRLADRFERLAHVGRVDCLSDFVPSTRADDPENQTERLKLIRQIRQIRGRLNFAPINQGLINKLVYELKDFRDRIRELSYAETLGGLTLVKRKRSLITEKKNLFNRLITILQNLDANGMNKLRKIEKTFSFYMDKRINTLTQISLNPRQAILTPNKVPASMRENYLDDTGTRFIINIYPYKNIWEEIYLKRFTKATKRINEGVTGLPIITLDIINIIKQDGATALVIAFFAIFFLLWLNYILTGTEKPSHRIQRGLLKTVLTIIPLISGTILMLGCMTLLGIKFNLNNVIAFPLLLGMGIDDGVHITQRYITENYGNIPRVIQHTGKGVLITTLTTMASFGSIGFIAKHAGMASFGQVLFFGMAACCFVSIFLLAPFLEIFLKKSKHNANILKKGSKK